MLDPDRHAWLQACRLSLRVEAQAQRLLGAEGDNRLHAFRGDTGQPIFVSEPLSGLRHLQSLIATQDRLYVGADGRIYAFGF